jgi:hypothetical protein
MSSSLITTVCYRLPQLLGCVRYSRFIGGRDASSTLKHQMTEITQTLLNQMGGAHRINIMTGAKIVTDTSAATLVFKKQSGEKKITHLKVSYNHGTDLYDIQGFKYNRKTFDCPEVLALSDVYAEDLKRICEEITGLYFSF